MTSRSQSIANKQSKISSTLARIQSLDFKKVLNDKNKTIRNTSTVYKTKHTKLRIITAILSFKYMDTEGGSKKVRLA
jgi:hypothetical protein